MPLQGGCFTCSRGLNNKKMARFDCFFISDDWDSLFGGVIQQILTRPTSDHFPILIEGGKGLARGLSPFYFLNMWLKEEGFKDLVRSWWQGVSYNDLSSFILAQKLKATKTNLKSWNNEIFRMVETNKCTTPNCVAFWDD